MARTGIRQLQRKMCGITATRHKIRHPDEASAAVHAGELNQRHGEGAYSTYRCPFCGCWHVGSKRSEHTAKEMRKHLRELPDGSFAIITDISKLVTAPTDEGPAT